VSCAGDCWQNLADDAVSCAGDCWQNLADDAEKMWTKMTNVNDADIRLPHDGYVKLWQLRRPQLDMYDVLMIDEAQDLTPGETIS